MGWGIGVMPEQMATQWLEREELQAIHSDVFIDVRLHWHQWKLRPDDMPVPSLRVGALDQVGIALAEGARRYLRSTPG
jgi:LysR family transcriptional regulator (chromosome initiation inhibitor)